MGRSKKYEEEEDFNDIINGVGDGEIAKIKNIISGYLPKVIKIKAKNDKQKDLINSIRNNEITICAGPAGTGKSFCAIAYALSLLRKRENKYKRIYLVKSVTTLKNEEIGHLPGDIKDKYEPFLWSYYINIEKIIESKTLKQLMNEEIIKPFPLAYMRGASLDNSIILLDEAQNVTIDNSRTFLTRIGSNSKLIILGDTNQIDMKNRKESSLKFLMEIFKDTPKIGVINMEDKDTENVRNPLIDIIEDKFKEYYNGK